MPLDRGPSPLRPPIRGTTPSHRRFGTLLPVDSDVHPVIHAGRVAVITGAASGIGRAAAIELARCAAIALLPSRESRQNVIYHPCYRRLITLSGRFRPRSCIVLHDA
jgi:hypothetical protein